MPDDEVGATLDEATAWPPLPSASPPKPQLGAKLTQEEINEQLRQTISDQAVHFSAKTAGFQRMLEQQALIHNKNTDAVNNRIAQLERENYQLKNNDSPIGDVQGSTTSANAYDWENYLRCANFHDNIAPGTLVHPPANETNKPHLFSLHADQTVAALTNTGKHKAAIEEYRILYCMIYFHSCANVAFREFIQEQVPTEQQGLLSPLLNTYALIEEWLRKRLAYIRANHILGGNADFLEFLRNEIYQDTNASALGSEELAKIASKYQVQLGKAKLKQACNNDAFRSSGRGSGASKFDTQGSAPKKATLRISEKPRTYPKAPAAPKKESS